MGVEAGSISLLEPVLDALPSPKLLVEPGTGRVLYANPAAHRLAGGSMQLAEAAEDYADTYGVFDESGRRLPSEEHPGVRAARGERLRNVPVDWVTPAGRRSVVVSSDTVRLPGADPVVVVTFEDVTELQGARRRAQAAEEEIATILGGVADAVTAQAPDGTLVYANQAAVELIGYDSVEALLAAPLAEVAGRFEMLDEHLNPLRVEQLPGRRALAGEHPEPLIVRSRMADQRETRWTIVKSTPVLDAEGRVRLAINVIEDISELKRAEQGQRFLAEAGRVLAASLDYEETLSTVARLAVPDIADWCGVDVLADGELRRVAVAHVDQEKVDLAAQIARDYPPDPSAETGIYAVVRSGRSEVYGHITDELLAASARDERHLELLRSIGMTSVMIVPMVLRGTVLGVMTFVSAEAGHAYTGADLELAESLASHAAAAVENSRLFRARSEIAQTLQASLLPPALPDVRGFELGAVYRAAGEGFEVGGDFYDVFSTAEDQWYAVIGDVCGKGAEAAAVTALARYTIRATAVRRRSPSAILRLLSEAMLRQESADTAGRFCTIACLHLDVSSQPARATVACGGHPLPVILRAGGEVQELGAAGTLLGLVQRPELEDRTGELHPGDTLVLYTDGLTEAGPRDDIAVVALKALA